MAKDEVERRDDDGNRTNAASGQRGISPAFIGLVVVLAFATIFFFQNGEQTNIDFWLVDWDTTVRWSLLMAMFVGVVLDRLFSIWWRRRSRRKAAKP